MAVWDTVSANCPSCGDSLAYEASLHASVCRSCGNIYESGTLNYTGKFKFVDLDNASEREENKREYVCGSCGATIVTNENTAATICAFCGSPSLMARRLSKEFRPDYIIPFSIKEEGAKMILIDWINKNPNVPKALRSNKIINRISGIYVPFWLINAECHSKIKGLGYIAESSDDRAVFEMYREIKFKVKNVPFDGCLSISNFLMSAIEPFNYDEMVKYDDTYLPGYYAYRYDKNALDMMDVINIRIEGYAQQAGEMVTKMRNATDTEKAYTDAVADSSESYLKNLTQSYALMPVWFLNVEYMGEEYTIAINGQTGSIAGDIPENRTRAKLTAFRHYLIPVASVVIVTGGLIFACMRFFEDDPSLGFGISFAIAILAIIAIVFTSMLGIKRSDKVKEEQEKLSISTKPKADISSYFDYSFTPEILSSSDKFLGAQIRRVKVVGVGKQKTLYEEWDWFS